MKLIGFKLLTEQGIDNYLTRCINDGTIGILHDIPSETLTKDLLNEKDFNSFTDDELCDLHDEMLFVRMVIPLCLSTLATNAYRCFTHNYFGSIPCNCGNTDLGLEDLEN